MLQLLAEGELVPGISADEFSLRRQKLAQLLPTGSVAVVPSAVTQYTSPGGRIPYSYRQVRAASLKLYVNDMPCRASQQPAPRKGLCADVAVHYSWPDLDLHGPAAGLPVMATAARAAQLWSVALAKDLGCRTYPKDAGVDKRKPFNNSG